MINTDFFFKDFPVLDLGEIILREIRISDASCYQRYMCHPKMQGLLTKDNQPSTYSEAESEVRYWSGLFTSKRSIFWCIADKKNDKMIGTAGYNSMFFSHNRAEMSYDLDPERWGEGIMQAALRVILQYSRLVIGLNRIQATVLIENTRSIKLLEKLDFKKEGILKAYENVDGKYMDYYMYGSV